MPELATAEPARVAASSSGASWAARTPWAMLAVLSAAGAAVAVVAALTVEGAALRIAGIVAGLGSLLAVALAVVAPDAREAARRAGLTILLTALGAAGAVVTPVGALLYVAIPCWLLLLARRGDLVALGLGTPTPPTALALGVALGGVFAVHMLLSAQLTFGYRLLEGSPGPVLSALAYDAGMQVIATECFFRGAVFNRLQRRTSFAVACSVATALTVVRYLFDPLLPPAAELRAGAAFYTGLLSVGNCWLFWRFGTLAPGLVSSFIFFAAYRLLTAR